MCIPGQNSALVGCPGNPRLSAWRLLVAALAPSSADILEELLYLRQRPKNPRLVRISLVCSKKMERDVLPLS